MHESKNSQFVSSSHQGADGEMRPPGCSRDIAVVAAAAADHNHQTSANMQLMLSGLYLTPGSQVIPKSNTSYNHSAAVVWTPRSTWRTVWILISSLPSVPSGSDPLSAAQWILHVTDCEGTQVLASQAALQSSLWPLHLTLDLAV